MALKVPEPPQESRSTLQEGLKRLAPRAKDAFAMESLGGAPINVLNSHHVFVLNRDQLDVTKLNAAMPVGWGYVVGQSTENVTAESPVASAEVLERGGGHQFSHIQHGWLGKATQRAISVAEQLPQVIAGSYELRMLRVPSLYTDALWLKNLAAGRDLVVPIASANPEIQADRSYDAEEFLAIMRDIAAKKAGFDNSPKG